jgi:hypothetical protein
MTTAAGTIISEVLERVNDSQGAIHSRDFTRETLARAQKAVNAITEYAVESTTFTSEEQRVFYPIASNFPNALKIVGIKQYNRDLASATPEMLAAMSGSWHRAVAEQHAAWATYGRDVLILWPASRGPMTLTVTYVMDTGDIPNESTTLLVPTHGENIVMDVAEALLLIRQKDFGKAEVLLKKIKQKLEVARG